MRCNPFVDYDDINFRRKYRFSKAGVRHLVDLFGRRQINEDIYFPLTIVLK